MEGFDSVSVHPNRFDTSIKFKHSFTSTESSVFHSK